jgi:ribosomal protein S1
MGRSRASSPPHSEHFQADDELPLKVTRTDLANHRMVLSVRARLAELEEEEREQFLEKYSQKRATVTESADEGEEIPLEGLEDEEVRRRIV